MIEIALILLGGVVVIGVLQVILKNLWLTFKWNVLGWKPRILDEELVTTTVERCAKEQAESNFVSFKEWGINLTPEDQEFYHNGIKRTMRSVIEVYIDRFTRK